MTFFYNFTSSTFFLSKILMNFLSFRISDSYFWHTIPPYMHTHVLFSRFCTLLCALVTVDTAYTISFVLIHHCTNSLSSLHIFVHHCTFCASLHTKTSTYIIHYIDLKSREECFISFRFCFSNGLISSIMSTRISPSHDIAYGFGSQQFNGIPLREINNIPSRFFISNPFLVGEC